MQDTLLLLGIYYALGIVSLVIMFVRTGGFKNRIRKGSYETQDRLAAAGTVAGSKTALVFVMMALWLFWPVAIFGALQKWYRGRK